MIDVKELKTRYDEIAKNIKDRYMNVDLDKIVKDQEEWIAMKDRCYRKSHEFYQYYGGKGIKVCDIWKNNFENFRDWALQNGYRDDLTIDRINNDEDYSPSNCRWVNLKCQANNRTNNILVFYNNDWISIEDAMKQTGKTYNQIYHYYRSRKLIKKIKN